MATEFMIANNGRPLNGENFYAWKIRMTSVLTALKLEEFITVDQNIENLPSVKRQQNAIARSILLNNIEDNLYPIINHSESAYQLMANLENLYGQDQQITLQDWMNKLTKLKAKNHHELINVINKMMSIFKQMENTNITLSEPEKINYMLGCMPNQLKIIFISANTDSAEKLFNDIKLKYKLLYHVGTKNEIKYNNVQDDKMDIDLIDNILNVNKNKNKNKSKFCHICKMQNHSTEECYFNSKIKKQNNKRNKYNKSQKFNSNQNHHHINSNRNNKQFNFINNKNQLFSENEDDNNSNTLYLNNINYDNNSQNKNFTNWIYDTGASEHITNNKDILTDFKNQQTTMKCANDTSCTFSGYGTYYGKINNQKIRLDKVYYSKDISKNLISGIKLAQSNIKCLVNKYYDKPQLTITQNNKIILRTYANKHNNFNIKTKNIINKIDNLLYNQEVKNLWHNRLGHYHNNKLNEYLKEHNINITECIECKISKLNRKPHNGITPEATKINEIIYSDIMGPINDSINKNKYLITFIDDFSRKAWIYPIETKSEATNTIINFIKFINNQHPENKIKTFKSDNAKEYNNKKIKIFCKRNGINKIFSPPYNPQNNGIAERFNRTITSCIKTMLHWQALV